MNSGLCVYILRRYAQHAPTCEVCMLWACLWSVYMCTCEGKSARDRYIFLPICISISRFVGNMMLVTFRRPLNRIAIFTLSFALTIWTFPRKSRRDSGLNASMEIGLYIYIYIYIYSKSKLIRKKLKRALYYFSRARLVWFCRGL